MSAQSKVDIDLQDKTRKLSDLLQAELILEHKFADQFHRDKNDLPCTKYSLHRPVKNFLERMELNSHFRYKCSLPDKHYTY
mmetsp:Transcript_18743/g.38415  ORF Transcript_18743/g.38415 Transcript_18743/m.38415 type:complete len:81 (-) Transcript_18743:2083-2325(-)